MTAAAAVVMTTAAEIDGSSQLKIRPKMRSDSKKTKREALMTPPNLTRIK